MLHLKTLYLLLALTLLVDSAALWISFRLNRGIPGISSWAFGVGCLMISLLLVGASRFPAYESLTMFGNIFGILGYFYIWRGFRLFTGRKMPSWKLVLIVFALFSLLQFFFSASGPSFIAYRSGITSIFIMVLIMLSSYDLLTRGGSKNIAQAFLALIFLSNGIPFGIRGVFTLLHGVGEEPLQRPIDVFVFFGSFLTAAAMPLGMILMTANRLQNRLRRVANTDSLTGLLNRRGFFSKIKEFRDDEFVSVLLMDLDRFKNVNDKFGHEAGDQTIRAFANLLKAELRATDVSARFGGEEFATALPGVSLDEALRISDVVRDKFSRETMQTQSGERFQLTVSIGIAGERNEKRNIDDLLREADQALYESKSRGRNLCTIYGG